MWISSGYLYSTADYELERLLASASAFEVYALALCCIVIDSYLGVAVRAAYPHPFELRLRNLTIDLIHESYPQRKRQRHTASPRWSDHQAVCTELAASHSASFRLCF